VILSRQSKPRVGKEPNRVGREQRGGSTKKSAELTGERETDLIKFGCQRSSSGVEKEKRHRLGRLVGGKNNKQKGESTHNKIKGGKSYFGRGNVKTPAEKR